MLKSTPLFQLKHGNHICVFYRDQTRLLETLAPYVAEALRKSERCFCAQKRDMIEPLHAALKSIGVDEKREINRGALEIRTENEVYLGGGNFDPAAMMQVLETSITDSRKQGFTGFRFAGEGSWAAEEGRADQLIEYERMVDAAFEKKPAIIICQYDTNPFSEKTLKDTLESHRLALETMAGANHSSLIIRHSDYVVEIVADRENPRTKFYYVAQPRGSNEIVGWGAEQSFDDAVRQGESLIRSLTRGKSRAKPC